MGSLGGVFAQRVFDQCRAIATAQCPLGIEMTDDTTYDHYHKWVLTIIHISHLIKFVYLSFRFCIHNNTSINSMIKDDSYFRKKSHHLITQLIGKASFLSWYILHRCIWLFPIVIACIQFIASGISYTTFLVSSKRQTNRIRQTLFRTILNKVKTNIDWNRMHD